MAHATYDLNHCFWMFLLLVSFIWVLVFSTEPHWVKTNGELSKMLCLWYAFVIAILIVLFLLVVYLIIRLVQQRQIAKKTMAAIDASTERAESWLERLGMRPAAAEALTQDVNQDIKSAIRETPGRNPQEKMRNILDDMREKSSPRKTAVEDLLPKSSNKSAFESIKEAVQSASPKRSAAEKATLAAANL